MVWLGNNWIWILIVGGMAAMHLFGHRGHGSSHKHGVQLPERDSDAAPGKVPSTPHSHEELAKANTTDPQTIQPADEATKHKHGC